MDTSTAWQRWGLSCGESVEQTEADLKAVFPEASWYNVHLLHRAIGCPAKSHDPGTCPVVGCCGPRQFSPAIQVPSVSRRCWPSKRSARAPSMHRSCMCEGPFIVSLSTVAGMFVRTDVRCLFWL
jgi:hypothetical protein